MDQPSKKSSLEKWLSNVDQSGKRVSLAGTPTFDSTDHAILNAMFSMLEYHASKKDLPTAKHVVQSYIRGMLDQDRPRDLNEMFAMWEETKINPAITYNVLVATAFISGQIPLWEVVRTNFHAFCIKSGLIATAAEVKNLKL